MYDTMIVGGYGVGNIGDEAILRGLLKTLKGRIVVISHTPEETKHLHGIDAVSPSPINILKTGILSKEIKIGGGGIFSEYIGPYAKMIPYFAIGCKLIGKKVNWDSIGIYPSTPTSTLKILRFAMRISDKITLRDEVSFCFVTENLGIDASRVPDSALSISPAPINRVLSIFSELDIDSKKRIVGIAPRRTKEYNKRIMRIYCKFIEGVQDSQTEIILIPFCKHKYAWLEKDHEAANDIKDMVSADVKVISQDYTPEEILGIISQMDFLLATRFHSLLFAYMTGINFVCLEYAEKCTSFLKEKSLEEKGYKLSDVESSDLIEAYRRLNI